MSQKTFSIIAGVLFSIFALLHIVRLIVGWHVMIGNLTTPMGVSWIALGVFAYLGYSGLRLGLKG